MEGDCNVYALFAMSAPIIRMVYSKVNGQKPAVIARGTPQLI